MLVAMEAAVARARGESSVLPASVRVPGAAGGGKYKIVSSPGCFVYSGVKLPHATSSSGKQRRQATAAVSALTLQPAPSLL